MTLTVCPIPNFADEFCGALVLWRRAMAPYYGVLVMQALSRIRDASTLTSNNSATSPLIKILKSAFSSQRRNWLYAQFLILLMSFVVL